MKEMVLVLMSFLSMTLKGCVDNFCDLFYSTPRPPVIVPIDLTKAGNKTEMKFRINAPYAYYFKLEFYYNDPNLDHGLDAKKASKIAGYNAYYPGGIKLLRSMDYKYAKRNLGELGLIRE